MALEYWGAKAADRYHNAFFDHFKELAKQPLLYAVSDVRKGYRRSICGKDSVFYRIDGQTVEIMAIVGQQDVNEWL